MLLFDREAGKVRISFFKYTNYGKMGCQVFKSWIENLDKFQAKNQLLYENRNSVELSQIGHHFIKSSVWKIEVDKKC